MTEVRLPFNEEFSLILDEKKRGKDFRLFFSIFDRFRRLNEKKVNFLDRTLGKVMRRIFIARSTITVDP